MNLEHQSSKRREEDKTKELEKKVDNLERTLELVKKTIDHDNQMKALKPLQFGHYEMT